jgi:hypothetical protein
MGRFLINLMMAAGGYPWTVIPVAARQRPTWKEFTGLPASMTHANRLLRSARSRIVVFLARGDLHIQHRLIKYREDGGGGLIHEGRGRASNHRLNSGVREYALELIRPMYADFGPTLAIEVLAEYAYRLSREPLATTQHTGYFLVAARSHHA